MKIGTAAFIFRDVLQYILPTFIAAILFLPLFGDRFRELGLETLLLGSAIVGFLGSTPVSWIAKRTARFVPLVRRYDELADWHQRNWDYSRLFYTLDKDEREYLYLTGAYLEFYRTVSLHLLVYAGINLFRLAATGLEASSTGEALRQAGAACTPLLGTWEAPSWILMLLAAVLATAAFRDFVTEYRILFLDRGQYLTLAEHKHRNEGAVAVAVWGTVSAGGKPVVGADVRLCRPGVFFERQNTDRRGCFQFRERFRDCLGGTCTLEVRSARGSLKRALTMNEKEVPRFDLRLS